MSNPFDEPDLVTDEGLQPEIPSAVDGELTVQEFETVRFVGPLPPPEILDHYDQVLPGLADRIVTMAESNIAHFQDMDQRTLKTDALRSFAGLTAGFVIALLFGGIAASLIYRGHTAAGIFLGSIDLVALVTIFVLGRRPIL